MGFERAAMTGTSPRKARNDGTSSLGDLPAHGALEHWRSGAHGSHRTLTGNFIDSGPHGASTSEKKGIKSGRYEPIPYASEQGIFCGLAGNLNRRSGKFPPRSGNPALVRYLGPTGPTNPILPRDLERCREARGTPPDARVTEGPGMRKIARRARDARLAVPGLRRGGVGQGRAPGGIQRARTGVMPRKLIVNMAIPFLTMTKAN
jgi:hypothetical protein